MRFQVRSWLSGLVVGAALLVAPVAQAELKIAVVDTQRAMGETEDGMRASATLKKLFDSKQQEIDRKQGVLAKERQDIEKQKGVLSAEALQKRFEAWQKEAIQLQSQYVEYNRDLQKKQADLTQPIIRKLMEHIRRLANTEQIDIVLDRVAAPYVRSDLDLTEKLVRAYNSGAGGGKKDKKKGKGDKAEPEKAPEKAPEKKDAPAPKAPAKSDK